MGRQSEVSGNFDLRRGGSWKFKKHWVPGRECPCRATNLLEGRGLLAWGSPGQGCQVSGPALAATSRHHRKGWGEGKLPLAFASMSCLFWELCRGASPSGAGHVPFLRVWEEGPHGLHLPVCYSHTSMIISQTLSLLGHLGLLWFTAQGISSSLGVSAEQPMPGGCSLKNVLEFTAEAKELQCCIKPLASTINSH